MLAPYTSLMSFPRQQVAQIAAVDWDRLVPAEARRLRELGFDEGVAIEVLHGSALGGGPLACRVGRMTVALRRTVAAAIHVAPVAL